MALLTARELDDVLAGADLAQFDPLFDDDAGAAMMCAGDGSMSSGSCSDDQATLCSSPDAGGAAAVIARAAFALDSTPRQEQGAVGGSPSQVYDEQPVAIAPAPPTASVYSAGGLPPQMMMVNGAVAMAPCCAGAPQVVVASPQPQAPLGVAVGGFPQLPQLQATLPPDEELMRMTSDQIEDYIRACKASARLSVLDERRLRKVRRLIKNREYAQQSRNKKKQLVGEMEKDLSGVREENTRLAAELEEERQRNAELEAENAMLRQALEAAGLQVPKLERASAQQQQQQQPTACVSRAVHRRTVSSATGVAAACLLAVTIFGLFVGPLLLNGGMPGGLGRARSGKTAPVQTGRVLFSVSSTDVFSSLSSLFNNGGGGARSHSGSPWASIWSSEPEAATAPPDAGDAMMGADVIRLCPYTNTSHVWELGETERLCPAPGSFRGFAATC
eukprot:m51a1_g3887 putative bzip transcription factor domain containing protein (446) ;mRNA; r:56843-58663